jgi:hypothetical protein
LRRFEQGKIYPYKNPSVIRIVAKAVRGLAFHHGLCKGLPQQRVLVTFAQFRIPDSLLPEANYQDHREEDVFRYWGHLAPEDENEPTDWHTFWRLRYFDRVDFDTWILKEGHGGAAGDPLRNEG